MNRLLVDARAPNDEKIAAIQELEAGRGVRCESVEALMANLNADN